MNKCMPEVRFKGFSEEWDANKLSNLAEFSKGSGYTKNDLVDSGTPIILYGRLYTNYENIISEVDTFVVKKNNSVISEGNEVIVPSSGESPEDIARASVVKIPNIILGGDLNIIKANTSILPNFLSLTLSNGSIKKELSKKAQGKSIVHLHNSDLKKVTLIYPTIEEQRKIGDFFEQLDTTITLQQRLIEQKKQYKKAMLQKMFTQKGESIPKVRFKEFGGNWAEKKMGEVFEQTNEYINPQECNIELFSVTVEKGLTQKTARYNREFLVKKVDKFKKVGPNEFVYNPMNMTLGAVGFNDLNFNVAVSGYYITMKINKEYDSGYFKIALTSSQMIGLYKQYATGSLIEKQRVQFPNFSQIAIRVPHIEEQRKIGEFFKNIDETIALHEKKLYSYQQLKKALLQRMFI